MDMISLKKICFSNLEIKPVTARVNTLKISKQELLEKEPLFQAGNVSEDALIYHGSHLAATSYFKEGFVSIQDEASQMVAYLLDPNQACVY